MSTKISVICPVAPGRLSNLRNSLYSLANQKNISPSDFETIIVQDGGEEDMWSVVEEFSDDLSMRFLRIPKFLPREGSPPRNMGARVARFPFLMFMDSDIILNPDVLSLFMRDLEKNPNRVIGGLYDWLPPARITEHDIDGGLDAIYTLDTHPHPAGGDEQHVRMIVQQRPYPLGHQTHNVSRDMRRPMFFEHPVDHVYYGPGNMNAFLGAFSGLITYPANIFWATGGFWDDLTAGLVDDGSLGLTLWHMGYGISFDPEIRGAHQYHDRDVTFIQKQSAAEVEIINRRFGLEGYNDGRKPIIPKSVYALTEEAHKAWGVDRWAKSF